MRSIPDEGNCGSHLNPSLLLESIMDRVRNIRELECVKSTAASERNCKSKIRVRGSEFLEGLILVSVT